MNWDALSALGTILGSATVFVTLIFLAIQTRQNTKALRSASFHQIRESFSEIPLVIAQDREIASLLVKVSSAPNELTTEEVLRYEMLLLTIIRRAESAYFQSSEGALHEDSWRGISETCKSALADEIARSWWDRTKNRFNDSFCVVIDQLLEVSK